MKSLKFLFVAVAGVTLAAFNWSGAAAHETDEFSFTGVANESCISPHATTWTVTWTIENFGPNPFGIVGTDPAVGFAPLVDDAAPGAFIPVGASATAVSIHSVDDATASLTVTHDVTGGDDVDFTEMVMRPAPCVDHGDFFDDDFFDLELEIKNQLNNINQNTNISENVNLNENNNVNTQNQTNDQNTNVITGDVNVKSTGGSGTGTGTGKGH